MISLNSSTIALIAVALIGVRSSAADWREETGSKNIFSANVAIGDPAGGSVAVSPASERAVTITKASDGLFYLDGAVNGASVRFLIDTGANMVVLTEDDARRVGVLSSPYPTGRMETAGGQSAMNRVSLNKVRVAGKEAANVDAAVMRNGLGVSLLGQNMLSKLGRITMSENTITIQARR